MNQKTITLKELTAYLDTFLESSKIEEGAPNGVQVANTGSITRIATAVTASLEAIEKASQMGAQALIVHHGIFRKGDAYPLMGIKYRKIKALMDNNIALLGYHLPLDAHQEVGNNWKAARDLGLQNLEPFGEYNRVCIGVIGTITATSFDEFKKKVEAYYGQPAASVNVKDPIKTVAIISGGAEKSITAAAHAGADCFITGTVDEPVWDSAHEEGISFLGLGHYATETVGPKALAAHLQETMGVSCSFIATDNPF